MNHAIETTAPSTSPSKALSAGLWAAQGLLAFAFGASGLMKLTTPIAELVTKLPWVVDMPATTRFIGLAEVLGAVGLLLPAITRIQPRLTALAGAGLTTIMLLASLFHLSRGEAQMLPVNLVLGSIAAFVAWGRSKKAPIAPR